jgi:starch phosphorylase
MTTIAYFSMEIAVDDDLPTYSGGLGVLAGDHVRSAADLGLPMAAVTLLYRGGYFDQVLDEGGRQREHPVRWNPAEQLERLGQRTVVTISGRPVHVAVWRRRIVGVGGHRVPVYFLDTRLSENDAADQDITDQLYSGGLEHRLRQEAVLGLAGPAMLAALGHGAVGTFHMNEGHSSLLTLALLERSLAPGKIPTPADVDAVRCRCVFTTHTPVPAGHDRFPLELVERVLGEDRLRHLEALGGLADSELNMTTLGMAASHFVNAVATRHAVVSREMFPQFPITSITNGVHAGTWASPSFRRLFDRHLPGWRKDNASLRYASAIPLEQIHRAHSQAKRALLHEVAERTGAVLDPRALTLGVARRATPYKRIDLLLRQPERLLDIAARVGPVQVLYSGKAHPRDERGKELITRIFGAARELDGAVRVLYLPGYSLGLAAQLVAGCDVWVNTPEKPYEASGTSGMKAALNGVPSMSTLDGWWVEGYVEGVTGWAVGDATMVSDPETDTRSLYEVLEHRVARRFYTERDGFLAVRRAAVALNGSFFNTERMVREYARRAYHTKSLS